MFSLRVCISYVSQVREAVAADTKLNDDFRAYYTKVDAEMARVEVEEAAYYDIRVRQARNKTMVSLFLRGVAAAARTWES